MAHQSIDIRDAYIEHMILLLLSADGRAKVCTIWDVAAARGLPAVECGQLLPCMSCLGEKGPPSWDVRDPATNF